MTSHTVRSGFVLGLAVGACLLAPVGARAQGLSDGWDALYKKWREHSLPLREIFKGQKAVNPDDKQTAEALDLQAKYDTYRVYLDHLDARDNPPNRTIDRAFKDFEGGVSDLLKYRPNTQAAIDVYRDRVRAHALEVIQYEKAKPIHKIHNARVLAKIAELGQGKPLADTLLTVLKDPAANDGVRYWSLRGLRVLLSQVNPQQMPPLLAKEDEAGCAGALVEFLERKSDLSKKAPKEEIDGFRLLRREAVRALAQVHTPSFGDKLRPALVLARFAGDDERIDPRPRIDERFEAALGLARMQAAASKDYQPDAAAGQIAKAIGAFAAAANNERDKKGEGERTYPWRIDAGRMANSLAALKAGAGKDAFVAQVADRGARLMQGVQRGGELDAGELTWFTTEGSDAPNKELFKGAADSVIKPAKAEEAAEK